MTGIPNKNKSKFEETARIVKAIGMNPITPFDLDVVEPCDPADWVANMKRDVKFLMGFDGVVVLRGWELSKGARVEVALARLFNLPIFYVSTNERTNKKDLKVLNVAVDLDVTPLVPSNLLK